MNWGISNLIIPCFFKLFNNDDFQVIFQNETHVSHFYVYLRQLCLKK